MATSPVLCLGKFSNGVLGAPARPQVNSVKVRVGPFQVIGLEPSSNQGPNQQPKTHVFGKKTTDCHPIREESLQRKTKVPTAVWKHIEERQRLA